MTAGVVPQTRSAPAEGVDHRPLRLLLVHNFYQQRGGEETTYEAELALLRDQGHHVKTLEFHNDEIPDSPGWRERVALAGRTVWSPEGARRVGEAVREHRAEVAHFHNTFPLVSPAAYRAARNAGAAVVQTLQNFRLICPSALLYRDGGPCEDCVGKFVAWPGVLHGCFRGSSAQSGVVAAMQTFHRVARTWRTEVDAYIALTQFGRERLIEGGLPADRIAIKPNFVHADATPGGDDREGYLFVGRLDEAKGLDDLFDAWRDLPGITLRVAGDGPMRSALEAAARRSPQIEPLGRLDRPSVLAEMRRARALVFPSRWYEGFPLTIAEAQASATPVIASGLGAMGEIVHDGRTGLHFQAGNPTTLAERIRWAEQHPAELRRMGSAAREETETKYTPEQNHALLLEIYRRAMATRRGA